jgi:hypothetical protein
MLTIKKDAATDEHEHHEQRRKDASVTQRRAQAHRLRMQLRAAKLRADAAEADARERLRSRDEAGRALAAWRMVGDVQQAKRVKSRLSELEERTALAGRCYSRTRGHMTGRQPARCLSLRGMLSPMPDTASGRQRCAARMPGTCSRP